MKQATAKKNPTNETNVKISDINVPKISLMQSEKCSKPSEVFEKIVAKTQEPPIKALSSSMKGGLSSTKSRGRGATRGRI